MFELPEYLPQSEVPDGTNILVSGPSMTGKRDLVDETLRASYRRGDSTVLVTTEASGELSRTALRNALPAADDPAVGAVQVGTGDRSQLAGAGKFVEFVMSPGDLTGIGIHVDRFLREFRDEGDRLRLSVSSLMTLLMYSPAPSVFKFIHTFAERLKYLDGLSVFVMDGTEDADSTLHFGQLFDYKIETRRMDAGPEYRMIGRDVDDERWQPLEI